MKLRTTLAIVLMSALMLVAMLPQAQGETEENGYVWLYDNAANGAPNATTDWQVYVETPSYVGLDDASGYWNFTVYAEMVNNTGRAVTSTLKVKIYLNSEGVNVSEFSSLAMSKTATVYGNISFPESVYSTLPANNSASIYVLLANGAGFTRNDSWPGGAIVIVTQGASGMLFVMLPSLVGLVIIVAVVGFVFEIMADMNKVPGGKRHSKKESKRRK